LWLAPLAPIGRLQERFSFSLPPPFLQMPIKRAEA